MVISLVQLCFSFFEFINIFLPLYTKKPKCHKANVLFWWFNQERVKPIQQNVWKENLGIFPTLQLIRKLLKVQSIVRNDSTVFWLYWLTHCQSNWCRLQTPVEEWTQPSVSAGCSSPGCGRTDAVSPQLFPLRIEKNTKSDWSENTHEENTQQITGIDIKWLS